MSRIAPSGLPNNPRFGTRHEPSPSPHRSSSRGRAERQPPPMRNEEPRSLRSISATRPRHDPVERSTRDPRRAQSRARIEHSDSRRARTSVDSTSTSASGGSTSSFWEKGSARSYSTTASEEYPEAEQKPIANADESVLGGLLDTTYYWSRATEAASALSQGVSNAWSTGLASQFDDGPEDDSHLLKVMRAYHLSKARNPAELPKWLFSERERGGKGTFSHHNERQEASGNPPTSSIQTQRDRRRQEGHARPINSGGFTPNKEASYSKNSSESMPRRKPDGGVERLKTLRDRQRNAGPARF